MPPYDVKRELRQCYAPRNTGWELVDVPAQQFIAVDGRGDPNTSEDYAHAVEALYSVAYTLKFTGRRTGERDFVVGPLEGLWWSDRMEVFTSRDKDVWQWRMLISRPDWITEALVDDAKEAALAKKGLPRDRGRPPRDPARGDGRPAPARRALRRRRTRARRAP
ncbi:MULTISPECIES: hypothetical protein [unclassified Streptomyces]|uniref:hypothetical protein n=1 Tax=unclassified Streptomyces TaxID=2593676 RepID=UPI0035DBC02C